MQNCVLDLFTIMGFCFLISSSVEIYPLTGCSEAVIEFHIELDAPCCADGFMSEHRQPSGSHQCRFPSLFPSPLRCCALGMWAPAGAIEPKVALGTCVPVPLRGGTFTEEPQLPNCPSKLAVLGAERTGSVLGGQAPCHGSRWGWGRAAWGNLLQTPRARGEGRVCSQQPRNGPLSPAPSSTLNGSVMDFKSSVLMSKYAVVTLLLTKLFQPECCSRACNRLTES